MTDRELSSSLDLFEGRSLSEEQKTRIRQDVGDYLLEQTLFYVGSEQSPIEGEGWKATLSKEYKKRKEDEIGVDVADLQFSGRLLDQVAVQGISVGIKIGVFGERAPVADGHCNFSGKSSLPRRRFLPDSGQTYKDDIMGEIDNIIQDIIAETEKPELAALREVTDSKSLFAELKAYFDDRSLTRAELRNAVFRNPEILNLLMEEELLDYL